MRLLLTIVFAGTISIAIGVGAIFAIAAFLPSYDDAAGRGLGQVFMVIFVVVWAAVCMLTLGLAARHGERRLYFQMLWMIGIPTAIVLFGATQALTNRSDLYELKKEFFFVITVLLPLVVMVATQWLILRVYLRWPSKTLDYSSLRRGRGQAR